MMKEQPKLEWIWKGLQRNVGKHAAKLLEERRLCLAAVTGATVLVSGVAFAQGVHLAPSSESGAAAYTYHNRFPKGTSTFPTTESVGGGVFEPGLKPGGKFPMGTVVYDTNDKPHTLKSLKQKGKPLVVIPILTAAPPVMRRMVAFQKKLRSINPKATFVLVNVAQFGSSLQPHSAQANNGKTNHIVEKRYGLSLPIYWTKNDIYSASGFTNKLRIRSLPTYFVIDSQDGNIAKIFPYDHTKWTANSFKVNKG